jgi:hypothetical protein
MAAIVPETTEYSTQINKIEQRSDPAVNVVDVQDLGARSRIAQFNFTALANIAEDKWVKLAKVPRGAKVIGFRGKGDTATATTDLQYWLVPVNNLDDGSAVALSALTDSSSAHDVSLDPVTAELATRDEAYVMVKTSHDTSGTVIALGDVIDGFVEYILGT